jgi:hypothetical protein
MPNRTAIAALALAVTLLALTLVPVVLHAGFGVELWPLTQLLQPAPAVND